MSDKIVKSVRRVFEVLELFERDQRPLAAVEIARKLQLPLTSTHAILKSMSALGYLEYNREVWSYFPSHALPNLVEWVQDSIEGNIEIVDFLTELSRTTRETINLSRPVDTQVKIVYGLESKFPIGVAVSRGTTMPIAGSLTGLAALACIEPEESRALVSRVTAHSRAEADILSGAQIEEIIADFKRDGMALRCDLFVRGVGAICLPITAMGSDRPLVVGVVGPSDRLTQREAEYKYSIIELIKKFKIKTCFKVRSAKAF